MARPFRLIAASLGDGGATPKIVLGGVAYRIEEEVMYERGFYFVLVQAKCVDPAGT